MYQMKIIKTVLITKILQFYTQDFKLESQCGLAQGVINPFYIS